MSAYVLGTLLGRLIGSYFIVWLVMWGVSRLKWRKAFVLTHRWYGWLSILILFFLGIVSASLSVVA